MNYRLAEERDIDAICALLMGMVVAYAAVTKPAILNWLLGNQDARGYQDANEVLEQSAQTVVAENSADHITVRINSVVYDSYQFAFSYELENDQPDQPAMVAVDSCALVNGKELGTTQLPIPEAGLSPYSSENASASGEKLVPTGDGLWQLVSFWEPDPLDDDEFPAMVAGDSLLIRVPELGADGQ